MQTLWLDDSIQFPRLLAEIFATIELDESDWRALEDSMNLDRSYIIQIFDRAQTAFNRQVWGVHDV